MMFIEPSKRPRSLSNDQNHLAGAVAGGCALDQRKDVLLRYRAPQFFSCSSQEAHGEAALSSQVEVSTVSGTRQ
jgi:hypothetical protein